MFEYQKTESSICHQDRKTASELANQGESAGRKQVEKRFIKQVILY
jgi:hypothetical protein